MFTREEIGAADAAAINRMIAKIKGLPVDDTPYDQHDFRVRAGGGLEVWDYVEGGGHHGPVCQRCGYHYCVVCERNGTEQGLPCVLSTKHLPDWANNPAKALELAEELAREGLRVRVHIQNIEGSDKVLYTAVVESRLLRTPVVWAHEEPDLARALARAYVFYREVTIEVM